MIICVHFKLVFVLFDEVQLHISDINYFETSNYFYGVNNDINVRIVKKIIRYKSNPILCAYFRVAELFSR